MDALKIGQFIQKKRKAKGLTQSELAERLHITDRAISKWECGRSMPDSSIMLELCQELGISVNELLLGEELQMNAYDKIMEKTLLQMVKEKEESDKRLLKLEVVLGVLGTVFLLTMILLGPIGYQYFNLPLWAMITMMALGVIIFFTAIGFCVFIEQKAGYYECPNCQRSFVPTYAQVLFAPHVNRTRRMKCPHCGKRAWHKKVISKRGK